MKTKCDCGAEKTKTTHVDWCSTQTFNTDKATCFPFDLEDDEIDDALEIAFDFSFED